VPYGSANKSTILNQSPEKNQVGTKVVKKIEFLIKLSYKI
jgi:hypothetical protein